MFTYKRWTADGWRKLAAALRERGLATVVTGAASDRAYLDDVWRDSDVMRLDGKLGMAGTLSFDRRRARLCRSGYRRHPSRRRQRGVRRSRSMGRPIRGFGGRGRVGGLDRPWAAAGTIQRRGNVWLVQNPLPCLPCQLEGCERRLDSHSQCLDELSVSQVVAAVDQALAVRQAA